LGPGDRNNPTSLGSGAGYWRGCATNASSRSAEFGQEPRIELIESPRMATLSSARRLIDALEELAAAGALNDKNRGSTLALSPGRRGRVGMMVVP
jgi:hypothetical protein